MSADATGRRSLLRTVATTALGVAGAVVVLPSAPEPLHAEPGPDAAAPPVPWDGPITTEEESPIARFQYARVGAEYVPTSPINVVFPLSGADADAEDALAVLEDAGWIRSPEEYVRYAPDRERGFVLQEATAAQTYYGTSGRYHVRCWEFEGVVSMQAHEDSGARPEHVVDSYDRARAAIESLFRGAGWAVAPAALDLSNDADPDHDGYATVIAPGGGP